MISSVLKVITGILQIRGGTDGTVIGNSGDRLLMGYGLEGYTPFGRIRTADAFNVFEATFPFDKRSLVFNEVVATGGTNTWITNKKAIDLAVTTTSGSSVIVQSNQRVRYNPAQSVSVQISANANTPLANNRKRLGQFDANNGLFFEFSGITPQVVIRSSTTGSIVDTAITQANWNIDKFDGTGASGITLDFSKHQLFIIEYGWQGIASVRFGFYLNGQVRYCHSVSSSNVLTTAYMQTANLPIRLENTNTGTAASISTISCNCIVVKNEGIPIDRGGIVRTFVNNVVKTVSANPTFTPVLSVRLSSASITGIAEILNSSIYGQTADDIAWKIIINTSLTGSTFATTVGYLQIDTAATALTGGTDVTSGFIKQGTDSGILSLEAFKYANTLLGATQAGVADILTLAASSRATTADVTSAITWREF
jgi:hypothetical protein